MRRFGPVVVLAIIVALIGSLSGTDAALAREDDARKFAVVPFEFDPDHSGIVVSAWLRHLGLPDERGKGNFGLLLSKDGKTLDTNASAGARLLGVRGIKPLSHLGYDIRKQDSFAGDHGSHCGAGAPRFNVVTSDNVLHFVGCSSPPPMQETAPAAPDGAVGGWIRLHWGPTELAKAFPPIAPTDTVRSITIIFDEGVDTKAGADRFGLAVIDNVRVNDMFAGKPGSSENDKKHKDDNNDDNAD